MVKVGIVGGKANRWSYRWSRFRIGGAIGGAGLASVEQSVEQASYRSVTGGLGTCRKSKREIVVELTSASDAVMSAWSLMMPACRAPGRLSANVDRLPCLYLHFCFRFYFRYYQCTLI